MVTNLFTIITNHILPNISTIKKIIFLFCLFVLFSCNTNNESLDINNTEINIGVELFDIDNKTILPENQSSIHLNIEGKLIKTIAYNHSGASISMQYNHDSEGVVF